MKDNNFFNLVKELKEMLIKKIAILNINPISIEFIIKEKDKLLKEDLTKQKRRNRS